MADGQIDVCLFNGAIRSSENEEMAHLLREKAKVLVAFGSCAHEGCIPGLANLFDRESIFERGLPGDALDRQSAGHPAPDHATRCPRARCTSPSCYNTVKTLDQVTDVDYYVPGCPPQAPQIWAVIEAILGGNLPPKGSVVGATDKTVCDECQHIREEKRITQLLPAPRDHPRPGALPARPGHHLRRAGDAGRLRRAVPHGEHALPGLLRPAAERHRPGRGAALGGGLGGGRRHRGGSSPHRRRDRGPGGHLLSLWAAGVAAAPGEIGDGD